MSYYEDPLTGVTDAAGLATIKLGPLPDPDLHYLGYAVISAAAKQATGTIYNRAGYPIAGASGLVLSLGPFLIHKGDYRTLKITGASALSVITGNLIGDVSETIDGLLVRPQPSQAGLLATVPGFTTTQIPVAVPSLAVPASAATNVAAWTYGAWVTLIAAGLLPSDPCGLSQLMYGGDTQFSQIQLGIGAAGSEVGIGEWGFPAVGSQIPWLVPIFPLIVIAGKPRLAWRVADQNGAVSGLLLKVGVYPLPL